MSEPSEEHEGARSSAAETCPEAYLEGIRLFNDGEWYDAHEAWEEHWQNIGDSSANFYKGLIQLAVAALHWERGNRNGASKLKRTGSGYLDPYRPLYLGLDLDDFLTRYDAWFAPLSEAAANMTAAPPMSQPTPRIELRRQATDA